MTTNKCRVCGYEFFSDPLLRYEKMPKGAQYLPDATSLIEDKGVDLEVFQCSGCGLVQLNNEPVPYYREVIRAAGISEEMTEFRRHQFNRFIQRYSLNGKKIIEIGCGRGEYLSIMGETGADAYGLEHLSDSVRYCTEKGLNVNQGFIGTHQNNIAGAPFNAFFILNFLEHLPDPNSTLRGIYHNLTDGGMGIIEVPNFNMILQKKLFSEFIGDHLFYFTKETLSSTLECNGFEVIECNVVWHDYIISAVVRKRSHLDISDFYQHQEHIKNDIETYIQHFDKGMVAIWGAGHQALAILSMLSLGETIKYVIDSAPFKQGKFTPATHIPIVAPDILNSDPVDAVIVMAASYSEEVARIIRQKYDQKIHVSILRDYGLELI